MSSKSFIVETILTKLINLADMLASSPTIEKVVFACFGPESVAAHEAALARLNL